MTPNNIRNIRESKLLSQDAVAQAVGISWATFCRIEAGRGKTTEEEVDNVLRVLDKMKPGTRKLAGRPYSDPKKQEALEAARLTGKPIADALAAVEAKAMPAKSKKATVPAQKKAKTAPAKKATAKKAAPAKADLI